MNSTPLMYELIDAYPWVFAGIFVIYMVIYLRKGNNT